MADPWFEILSALRSKSDGPFTARWFANAAQIQPGPKSNSEKMAYGWLSKFLKWGYVSRAGTIKVDGRKTQTYQVTQSGSDCEPREGIGSQLERFAEAVFEFGDLRGTDQEGAAWDRVMKVAGEIWMLPVD